MEKVRYMISDAANIVNVESHVLRYWEEELELNIPRNEMGHRYYTKENIQEFQKIKELKEQGYQLKAIRMIVHNGSLNGQAVELAAGISEEAAEKKPDLRQIPQSPQNAISGAKVSMANDRENAAVLKGEMPPKAAVKGKESSLPADTRRGELENQQQSILENTDKMAQFTDLMTEIVGKALAANNQELSKCISEDVGEQVLKEMNYLMREQEEADEERFRKLDAAIRGNLKKKEPKQWGKKKA
ncbi:MAG: MerR family transcriptional regulator [Roseburia sp.]|nr:MerR family transcriptional regulator [Roseburia sp.]